MIKLAELKVRCGVDARDHEDDRLLEILEADAVAHFELATNLYFGPVKSHVELLHGGSGRLAVQRLRAPLVTLTSVEFAGSFGSEWTAPYATSAFTFTALDRSLYFLGGYTYPAGRSNVRVTYTGGYTAGSEPREVRAAIAGIVFETYRSQRRTPTPVEAPDNTGASALVIPGSAQDVINRWQRSPGT